MNTSLSGLLLMLLVLVSCGDRTPDKRNETISEPQAELSELEEGRYTVNCFIHKNESHLTNEDVYANLQFNLSSDNTGSVIYTYFEDANCLRPYKSGVNRIANYELMTVNGTSVLHYSIQGTITSQVYIPYYVANGLVYVDMNYDDGESAPYSKVPTIREMSEFSEDSRNEGLLFEKLRD